MPIEVRSIVGQRELWDRIHATTDRQAQRQLSGIVGGYIARIDAARAEIKAKRLQETPRAGRPLTPRQLAVTHYGDQMQFDDECRNADSRYSRAFVDESYVAQLRRTVTGSADNHEMRATLGQIIRKFEARGNFKAEFGVSEWREAARALAAAELESLARTFERDEGDFTGKPSHPLLTEKPPAPVATDPLAARILNDDSTKTA